MMRRSVRVTRQRDTYDGGIFYRVLGAYWVPDLNVVIKIDECARKAVTVLTPEMAGTWIRRHTGFVPRAGSRLTA
jgi:hypothetical protein